MTDIGTGKQLLVLDFDGVCHSYTSGWINAWTIPDPPVAGLFPFLEQALVTFRVAIYSSRSEFERGRDAMRDWFFLHAIDYYAYAAAEHADAPRQRADELRKQLEFPVSKPSAWVTIDDRAITFKGNWPSVEDLHGFKPWNDHLVQRRT